MVVGLLDCWIWYRKFVPKRRKETTILCCVKHQKNAISITPYFLKIISTISITVFLAMTPCSLAKSYRVTPKETVVSIEHKLRNTGNTTLLYWLSVLHVPVQRTIIGHYFTKISKHYYICNAHYRLVRSH
jgi:hypothetical protein